MPSKGHMGEGSSPSPAAESGGGSADVAVGAQAAHSAGSKEERMAQMEGAVETLLRCIGEDPSREGLVKTPARVARALLEMTAGYSMDAGALLRGALFDVGSEDMVVVQDIAFASQCEHHMLPFTGRVHIGYLPTGRVVGLSKLARVTDVYAKRLQVQERFTSQLARAVEEHVEAAGVAVMVEASHMCMTMRGAAKPGAVTTSTVYLGAFKGASPEARSHREEFHRQLQNARRGAL